MNTRDMRQDGYTHSPWSGKAYTKPTTVADMAAESAAVLSRHAGIQRARAQRATYEVPTTYTRRKGA